MKINNFYFSNIIKLINTYLNVKTIFEINGNKNDIQETKSEYFINKVFKEYIFNSNTQLKLNEEKKNEIKKNFKIYYNYFEFLHLLFPFLKKTDFLTKEELLLNELIDYNGKYHHLMKELFIFNRLWSNQKLFYNNILNKRKESNLKYKNINYYTRNFQRPIIYPILDYKNRYPYFTNFKIEKDFFIKDENEDNYNFDLDCPELFKIIYKYNKEIFNLKISFLIIKYNSILEDI